MTSSKKIINPITEGTIWKALLIFFFPILLGTLFQQFYNTIDAVIIGKFEGKEALAAVGGGTAVFLALLIGFFIGTSSGASVVISQLIGAKNDELASKATHTAIIFSVAGGAVMTLGGILSSSWVLKITGTPEDIMELSLDYLKIFFVSMVPMFVYNMISGILRAAGDSKTPLYILIASVIANIFLDCLFVILFRWGVKGVAWATVISQIGSMIASFAVLFRKSDAIQFRFSKLECDFSLLAKMLKIGLPTGIQATFYGFSNIIIQASINSFGTTTIAAWAAYGKIDAVFWTVVNAFGVSVTTFSGQNYGAGKFDRVKKSMWQTLIISLCATLFFTFFFLLLGEKSFLLFTSDSNVISAGMEILQFLAPVWITYISIEVLSGTIRGVGVSFVPMIISLFGICALRIIWLFTAVPAFHSVKVTLGCYPLTWIVTSILYWIYWLSGKWQRFLDSAPLRSE